MTYEKLIFAYISGHHFGSQKWLTLLLAFSAVFAPVLKLMCAFYRSLRLTVSPLLSISYSASTDMSISCKYVARLSKKQLSELCR